MPLYEEKLINPLAVRFSQDRIWPEFTDGTQIEDSLAKIKTVPFNDAAYDLVLRPPFPPMEIIRLKQERREADGERCRDEKGRKMMGEESWFTFDNRRLYCLQRAALQLRPKASAVVVKVLYDFPEVRCARHKFRTTTDGNTVKISLPDGQTGSLWNWQEANKSVRDASGSADSFMGAVRRDASKKSKEMLTDVPPPALLDPGSRNTTVAERFNLGASKAAEKEGKAAGMQLLNLLQGSTGPQDSGPTVGVSALFGPQPQPRVQAADHDWAEDGWDHGGQGWGDGGWGGGWDDGGWGGGDGWGEGGKGWSDSGRGWGDGKGKAKGRGGKGGGGKGGGAGKGSGKGGKAGGGGGSDDRGGGKGRRRAKG